MDFFEEATLRLKQQLKLSENKQVAQAIGMTSNAWTKRKQRGVFPEKELRAFAQQHPDLNINVDYVLTGGLAGANVAIALGNAPLEVAGQKVPADIGGAQAPLVKYADRRVHAVAAVLSDAVAASEGDNTLTPEEAVLVYAYRNASSAGRAAIVLAAQGISEVSGQGGRLK